MAEIGILLDFVIVLCGIIAVGIVVQTMSGISRTIAMTTGQSQGITGQIADMFAKRTNRSNADKVETN